MTAMKCASGARHSGFWPEPRRQALSRPVVDCTYTLRYTGHRNRSACPAFYPYPPVAVGGPSRAMSLVRSVTMEAPRSVKHEGRRQDARQAANRLDEV